MAAFRLGLAFSLVSLQWGYRMPRFSLALAAILIATVPISGAAQLRRLVRPFIPPVFCPPLCPVPPEPPPVPEPVEDAAQAVGTVTKDATDLHKKVFDEAADALKQAGREAANKTAPLVLQAATTPISEDQDADDPSLADEDRESAEDAEPVEEPWECESGDTSCVLETSLRFFAKAMIDASLDGLGAPGAFIKYSAPEWTGRGDDLPVGYKFPACTQCSQPPDQPNPFAPPPLTPVRPPEAPDIPPLG